MTQARFGIVYAAHIDADVSDAAFRLFVRLSSYADKDGYCFPGVALLAEKSGVQPRQIRKLLAELAQAGLIIREERYRADGSQCSSATRIPVPVEQAGVSQQDRGEWATLTVLEHTTRTHQVTHHPKTSATVGRAEEEGSPVPVFGALDDDQEMPEGRMGPDDYERPEKKSKPKFESVPKADTHHRVMYEFNRGLESLRVRSARGVMDKAVKRLHHDDGYSYAEIQMMVTTFFARHDQDIRAKAGQIDVGVMFTQVIPQLVAQTKSRIDDKRAGRESARDRSRRQMAEMRARLMGEETESV